MDQTDGGLIPVGAGIRHALLTRRNTVAALVAAAAGSLTLPVSRLVARGGASPAPESSQGALARGLELHKEQKYDEAVREFNRAIRSRPDSADAYMFRGIALANSGRFEDSVSDFSSALELREDGKVYLYRGPSYLAMGDRARAARDFRRALELPTDDERLAVTARLQLRIAEGAR